MTADRGDTDRAVEAGPDPQECPTCGSPGHWTTERRPEDDVTCARLGCEDWTHPVHHWSALASSRPAAPDSLDVDRLAWAIWARHYREMDADEIADWRRDLNDAFESYASPNLMAEEIAAEYARLAAPSEAR